MFQGTEICMINVNVNSSDECKDLKNSEVNINYRGHTKNPYYKKPKNGCE